MIEIAHNYSLQSLNTFGISSLAKHYIAFKTIEDITTFCTSVHVAQNHRYTLGYGSNTLFLGNFSGYVLHIQLTGIEIIKETIHYVWVKAAAGVNWHKLVEFCLSNGYGGIENLSLIPGSVGAAPIQNIGAYGVALQDSVDRVEAIEWSTGKKRIFTPSECEFGYRTSIFKTTLRNQYVITAIVLKLHKINFFSTSYGELEETLAQMKVKELSFKAISEAVITIRKKKLPDPVLLGNAGSFFQNPIIATEHYQDLKTRYPALIAFPTQAQKYTKVSAASLIEQAGLKGIRRGPVGLYPLHALIVVNYGGATGEEILKFALEIQQKVDELFRITLVPEVQIVR